MPDQRIGEILSGVGADAFRLDERGRVVIDAPELAERLREAGVEGQLLPASAKRSDTNIICCGNGTCPSKATELGAIVERFVGPGTT